MSNQSGNVILGTLVGAAVGFAAGILLAPAKGSETREQLAERGEDLKNSINYAEDRAVASLKDLR
jgi:gas vesicle protein